MYMTAGTITVLSSCVPSCFLPVSSATLRLVLRIFPGKVKQNEDAIVPEPVLGVRISLMHGLEIPTMVSEKSPTLPEPGPVLGSRYQHSKVMKVVWVFAEKFQEANSVVLELLGNLIFGLAVCRFGGVGRTRLAFFPFDQIVDVSELSFEKLFSALVRDDNAHFWMWSYDDQDVKSQGWEDEVLSGDIKYQLPWAGRPTSIRFRYRQGYSHTRVIKEGIKQKSLIIWVPCNIRGVIENVRRKEPLRCHASDQLIDRTLFEKSNKKCSKTRRPR